MSSRKDHVGRSVGVLLAVALIELDIGETLGLLEIEAEPPGYSPITISMEVDKVSDRGVVVREGEATHMPLFPIFLIAIDHALPNVFEYAVHLIRVVVLGV